jgi:5-methylthioadenosine/S-adenosylhomocysteine deaminase
MTTTLIKTAQIVSMDPSIGDLTTGDILIRDGAIERIAPVIDSPGAEIIDAAGMIALPGIIDAHNCVWQTILRGAIPNLWTNTYFSYFLGLRERFRAEDLEASELIGGLEMLSYGVTTVVDYCHCLRAPGHAEAALRGIGESGIRHLFTYSLKLEAGEDFPSDAAKRADAERIHARFHDPAGLTTIGFGIRSPGEPGIVEDFAFARSFGAHNCIHINPALGITELARQKLLGGDTLAIHGNLITNDELALMAEVGMAIGFTPSADVQGTPADIVRRAMIRGVPVLFGCDVPCHVASDTLMQLRIMFNVQGYLDGAMERSFASVPTRRPPMRDAMPLLLPRELLRIATIGTAQFLGMADRIGSLTPGKRADVLLVRKGDFGDSVESDACAHVLLQTSPRDIDTVMVDGRVRVRQGRLVDFDRARVDGLVQQARAHLV